MMNALTVDVEDYYQTNGLNIPADSWNQYESKVEDNTSKLLELFEAHQVQGTFFIVGHIAQRFPALIKKIASKGHEIGSHSNMHRMLTTMDAASFREDIRSSKRLLEDITGQAVVQYRAPSWSLNSERYEWLGILEEEGYLIDSSIQPFKTPLSGSTNAPIQPFRPIIKGRQYSIVEFPSTVWNLGPMRVPFSGGLYMRVMPSRLIGRMMHDVNRTRPGMVYVHPWEIDPEQPRLPASLLIRCAQYYRLNATEKKLTSLLKQFEFRPLGYIVNRFMDTSAIPNIAL